MSTISVEIIIILLLILLNGLFSMSELAIVSARKNRLAERAEEGSQGASTALELADHPTRFLSTVQIGITLIGILSGAFGGATLADKISNALSGVPVLAPYSQALGVVLVVVVITYLSLVLGELVPKRLALNNAEGVAMRVSRPMRILSKITTPIVSLLTVSTDLIVRVLRILPPAEPAVTEEDVQSMISQGTQLGVFDETEQTMVTHVFRLGDRRISTVMTPRTDVTFIDSSDPIEDQLQIIIDSGYSRLPVYSGNIENILGTVHVKNLFQMSIEGNAIDIHSALSPALFVPETMTALEVLQRMKESGNEMAMIIDEYGGVIGLVTLNDILEAIVGDVQLPQAGEDPEIVRREDGSLLVGGMVRLDEVRDIMDVDLFPDEEKGYYETLGGMMMTQLGRIPVAGDIYLWKDFRFEVLDMDGRRVDKVLVVKSPPE